MPGNLGRSTVTVLEAPEVAGDYNAVALDWGSASRTVVSGCTVDITGATETTQANDQTTTRAQLFMPPRAKRVTAAHRVEWAGRTWRVDGVPADPEGAGLLAGQVVSLLEVTG